MAKLWGIPFDWTIQNSKHIPGNGFSLFPWGTLFSAYKHLFKWCNKRRTSHRDSKEFLRF